MTTKRKPMKRERMWALVGETHGRCADRLQCWAVGERRMQVELYPSHAAAEQERESYERVALVEIREVPR